MLGRFEARVLWALIHIGGEASSTDLHRELETRGKGAAPGATFTAMQRLADKKFVSVRKGNPLPERGGKARNYYKITMRGRAALLDFHNAMAELGSPSELGLAKRGVRT